MCKTRDIKSFSVPSIAGLKFGSRSQLDPRSLGQDSFLRSFRVWFKRPKLKMGSCKHVNF